MMKQQYQISGGDLTLTVYHHKIGTNMFQARRMLSSVCRQVFVTVKGFTLMLIN